ncbi:MAG: HAD family phosphatase [Chloroflexota bacterium]|nr:HAD family phosphatase [Chloroflexota bacterium]
MAYRLIAADLDGTLRAEQQPFTPRVRMAVQRAQARGVRIVMATGRMFRTAEPYARDLGLIDPIICDHGATIRDLLTGELLFEQNVPREFVPRLAARKPEHGTLVVCQAEEFYVSELTEDAIRFVGLYREHLHAVPELTALPGEPQKIVFIHPPAITDRLFVELARLFGRELQVVQSFERYVEVTHRAVSKGNAVEWLARRWEIAPASVIAMGDQDNDRSMIEWAGLGVAMGNAVESVKAIADFIAPSAADDGVADVIEKFVLDTHDTNPNSSSR